MWEGRVGKYRLGNRAEPCGLGGFHRERGVQTGLKEWDDLDWPTLVPDRGPGRHTVL